MANPFFSGRIPQELLDHVEKHRESTGETKTDVLVKALAAYTGFKVDREDRATPASLTIPEILERLEKLETHVLQQKAEPEMSEAEKRQYSLLDQIPKTEGVIKEPEPSKTAKGETEILTTSEMVERGIVKDKPTLSKWKKNEDLPKHYKGIFIEPATEEEKAKKNYGKKGKKQSCWRVTPDNTIIN